MAKSQARRTNRAIALVVILILGGNALLAALKPEPVTGPTDTTAAVSNGEAPPDLEYLARPADTSLTWLYHSLSAEQFDYEMNELSCSAIRRYISTDLCAVVSNDNGSFMLVGTEGFWDPEQSNSAGVVKITLDLTVYVLTKDNGPARAMSVMDGSVSVDYDGEPAVLSAHTIATESGDVLVLHKRAVGEVTDSYDFLEEMQVIDVSPTGAPTVVAAYEGSNMAMQGDGTSVVISSDRYASPSKSGAEPVWKTFTYLSPAEGQPFGWSETMRSGKRLRVAKNVKPVMVDQYEWPNSASRGSDA
jgi:hypothetical protein